MRVFEPRSSRCCGRRSASKRQACSATKVPGIDRPHRRAELGDRSRPDSCRARCSPLQGTARIRCCRGWSTSDGGIDLGPIPKGVPVNLLANIKHAPEGGDLVRQAQARRQRCFALLVKVEADLAATARERQRRSRCAQRFANLTRRLLAAEQVPGLRRQPRPLFRHRDSTQDQRRGEASALSRATRQARADRVHQDVLTATRTMPRRAPTTTGTT